MQILSPIPVSGVQDHVTVSVAAISPSAPVAAASAGSGAGQTRSETGQRGNAPPRPEFPRPDPERPTGPPPAFDTTPLELEAERRISNATQLWGSTTAEAEPEPVQRQVDLEV
ncbi:hypothetical protein RGUI_1268 [Rhodovulum sp. P5]|uniref:hypothetical protein n=1 Tax=Rhodovulum sp. P5 TaxID=1564506 RepID=UPI0009C22309|nr:hypothetical protein [Rhodovulum sp. P5]ARE39409.1 hypothetical protein RGUI_1268 [Rhodovulum sp. P5]